MAIKITWEDKEHILPYGTRENQVWDLDLNEIKTVVNANADSLAGLEGGYQGVLLIADTPINDGYYLAGESGTYTNAGSLVVDLTNTVTFINVSETQTVFTKTEIPIPFSANGVIENGNTDAVSGGTVYPSFELLKNSNFLKTEIPFNFLDRKDYTDFSSSTKTNGTNKGLKIINNSTNFINTGKLLDDTTYSITLEGKCIVNNASYFGFGIKSLTDWGGIIYRGSSGARSLLNYNQTTFKTGATQSSAPIYVVGDVIKVRLIFSGGITYMQTAINDSWTEKEQMTSFNPTIHKGEIVLVIRDASTWDNITMTLSQNNIYKDEVFVSTSGNDTNSGTELQPLATINRAKELTKGKGQITLIEGDYFDDSFDLSGGIRLRCRNGKKARLIYGTRYSSATLESGYTRVYKVAHANTLTENHWLWQHDVNDEATALTTETTHPLHRGRSHRLQSTKSTWKNSLSELENSDNLRSYFYWESGFLYFTIVNGTNLSTNPIVVPKSDLIRFASGNIDMLNIEILYKSVSLSGCDKFTIKESSVMFANWSYGWQYGDVIDGEFKRCRASGIKHITSSGGDGFNCSNSTPTNKDSVTTSVMSWDNWSHDNFDDGDSLHQYANSSIFGGLYEFNGSGITSATGGHMSVKNAFIRNNTYTGLAAQGSPIDDGICTSIEGNSCIIANNGTNVPENIGGDDNIVLLNCVSVGGAFPTSLITKYNCVDL